MKAKTKSTVHTSRTIMFSELSKVMNFAIDNNDYITPFNNNVIGKKSSSGTIKTTRYLKQLYGFDLSDPIFRAFEYFWRVSEENEKRLLSIIYSISKDELLAESVDIIRETIIGEKAAIETFETNIENYNPNRFSPNTRKSMAQNIASSWKQAGFIEGKVKNIRSQPDINYRVACFAFLLAYLKGERGDYVWNSVAAKTLCLSEKKLRELAIECSNRDLMLYQCAGSVTSISFNHLLNKIGIDANENRPTA